MNHDPVKQAWQASVEIAGAPPLEDVRKGAAKFYRFIRIRNMIEYVSCAIVVVVFTAYVFILPHLLQKIGSVMVVVAACYAAWQLHRRASAVPPETAGMMPLLEFGRAQMVRQRDAVRGLFWWYILPFIPGLLVMILGNTGANAGEIRELVVPGWKEGAFVAGFGAFLAFVVWLNGRFARRLQRHIDEIDALIGRTK